MKKLLAGIVAIALASLAPADAADLGVQPLYKAPPPAPAPAFSWTGCYIGGQIGGGWGRDTVSIPNLALTAGVPRAEVAGLSVPPVSTHTSGVLGGGQIGCDYEFAPSWVIGIEGEGSATDITGDVTEAVPFANPFPPPPVVAITGTQHMKTDWIASATGRLGWAWDRVLFYGKGGAAWAGNKYSTDIPIFGEHLEASDTRPGWTVGAGVEYAFWNNWSARLEYDY